MGELWSTVVVYGENSAWVNRKGDPVSMGGMGPSCVLRGGHGWNSGLSGRKRGGGSLMTCH